MLRHLTIHTPNQFNLWTWYLGRNFPVANDWHQSEEQFFRFLNQSHFYYLQFEQYILQHMFRRRHPEEKNKVTGKCERWTDFNILFLFPTMKKEATSYNPTTIPADRYPSLAREVVYVFSSPISFYFPQAQESLWSVLWSDLDSLMHLVEIAILFQLGFGNSSAHYNKVNISLSQSGNYLPPRNALGI